MLLVEIGGDVYVAPSELVAIIDVQVIREGDPGLGQFSAARRLEGLPRSLVITERGQYLTPASPRTLWSRFGFAPRRASRSQPTKQARGYAARG